jgi:hypothetical protein
MGLLPAAFVTFALTGSRNVQICHRQRTFRPSAPNKKIQDNG